MAWAAQVGPRMAHTKAGHEPRREQSIKVRYNESWTFGSSELVATEANVPRRPNCLVSGRRAFIVICEVGFQVACLMTNASHETCVTEIASRYLDKVVACQSCGTQTEHLCSHLCWPSERSSFASHPLVLRMSRFTGPKYGPYHVNAAEKEVPPSHAWYEKMRNPFTNKQLILKCKLQTGFF